jgi:antitoxin VapB
MAIIIKDEETDELVRALASRTGETITRAVNTAVRERLQRMPLRADEIQSRRRSLARVLGKLDAMPTVDARPADEILGYNKNGQFD